MRFAISSFILGAALTTSVASAPLDRRVLPDNIVDYIGYTNDQWEHYASFCSNPAPAKLLKREASAGSDIEARADRPSGFVEVPVDNSDGYDLPIGLWSQNFVSCVGMVVVGTKADGTKAQALAHFLASQQTLNATWKKFKDLITGWDLSEAQAYLSIPNYDGDAAQKPSGWTDDDDKFGRGFVAALLNYVDEVAGSVGVVHARDFNTASTMDVSPDHVVRVNDEVIS